MASQIKLLTTDNHDRDRVGLKYVYPVVSRRAGGVSIGINLNPNNACNWACIYCQVPNLTRGGAPPLDLALLEDELNRMLDEVQHGDFMQVHAPHAARCLVDVAFSGNGEPTSASEFPEAITLVAKLMRGRGLSELPLRLITNGSLVHRRSVKEGLRRLADVNGEVWFKLDATEPARIVLLNGVHQKDGVALERLQLTAGLVPTWVQTCMLAVDGQPPSEPQIRDYLGVLSKVRSEIRGVLLYGLARPSMQPGADRISALPESWMEEMGRQIAALGVPVQVSC